MPNNPVQIILNTRDYFIAPDAGGFGPAKDFFADHDEEFREHRDRLVRQVDSIAASFQRSGLRSGVVKVRLRREAWAKSHRPQRSLFPATKRPCIGVSKLGELYYHVTLDDVNEVREEIAIAENETRRRVSRNGKEYISPSNQRSEVGAVEAIELPSAADKRRFGAQEAVRWLSDPRTASAYFVEFFSPPSQIPELLRGYYGQLIDSLTTAATEHGLRIESYAVEVEGARAERPTSVYAVRLLQQSGKAFDPSLDNHGRLLSILDANPYVRRVTLPPILTPTRVQAAALVPEGTSPALPTRQSSQLYAKVGIVDGGIGPHLEAWTLGTQSIIAPEHRQVDHGSHIGGLLIGGQALNGSEICGEPDGCDLFDISIFPDDAQQGTFEQYYPRGVVDFVAELESAVERAHNEHGIRVFNMSLNVIEPVEDDSYGIVADMIDRIADKHNVIFIISAGNLAQDDCRPEWPSDPQAALQALASRTLPDTLLQPAESARSIAVGALNPPGLGSCVEGAPTAYTRRGPGLRVGVKPDVAHYGGSLSDPSGLKTFKTATTAVQVRGTSFAAPLVAKSVATLDNKVASALSCEMLAALLIHGCEIPACLGDMALNEVARQFTGFGIPKTSDEMLETPDHAITLVFSDVLHANRELQFDFAWPRSLVNTETGACRGDVRMTLVYRPVLKPEFGSEFVRTNIDAHIRQEHGSTFKSRLAQVSLPEASEDGRFEHELIQHGLKWWPTKVYRGSFPNGKGNRSNWRVTVDSLVRSEEVFPAAGIPFALVLTISDIRGSAPVFNDLRMHLVSRNVTLTDIRTFTQVRIQP